MALPANERLWEDDPVAEYAFARGCDLAVSCRHRAIRLLLQRSYGGCVPPLRELQTALRAQGISVTQKVLKSDLAAMGGPPPS